MVKQQTQVLDVNPGPLWFKVTGMLNQNWAMVVEDSTWVANAPAKVTILFFDDHGAVFDELEYPNAAQADHALAFNGFTLLKDQPGFRAVAGLPTFPLTRAQRYERPVYSSGEYWHQPPGLERVTKRQPITPEGLERFAVAQAPVIDTVLKELRAGRKETHWMWFVFPQLHGLGHSRRALKYGIVDLDEARDYLEHPLLGHRLQACFHLVLQHQDRSASDIFGKVDSMKLRSCATLFKLAAPQPGSVFEQTLSALYGGKVDGETVELL